MGEEIYSGVPLIIIYVVPKQQRVQILTLKLMSRYIIIIVRWLPTKETAWCAVQNKHRRSGMARIIKIQNFQRFLVSYQTAIHELEIDWSMLFYVVPSR